MVKFRKRLLVAALSLTAVTSGALGAAMISSVSGSADEAGKEVNPIAKYEFKDTSNIGKDSMGKYDLTFRNAWKAGGTGDLLNEYTAIEGGGITFNNKLCLAADKDKNVFKDTSAVTMVLEVKMVSGSGTWGHIAGVGFANAKSTGLSAHSAADGANHVRIASKGIDGLHGCWDSITAINGELEKYHTIIISAQPGGKIRVWNDGVKLSEEKEVSATWTAYDENNMFSIGGEFNGAAAYTSAASLKNVVVYDFAMDNAAAVAYTTNGKLTASDLGGMTTISSAKAKFEGDATKVALNEAMSVEKMFESLNPATAELTLSDGKTATADVVWQKVEKADNKYYAVGTVNSKKLGYANLAGEVRYELTVASIKGAGEPVFEGNEITKGELKDSMTEAEMLALINTATVTVTLGDDTTTNVTVTFTKIVADMGTYTAQADVMLEGMKVATASVTLPVTQTNEGQMAELAPIAKWTFDSEETKLVDSMGKYNLQCGAKADGDRTNNPTGTGTVQNGMLYLDGTDMLTLPELNDVTENISNGFTLNFQVKQDGDISDRPNKGEWAAPVSFGFNDWNATTFCRFLVATSGGGDMLRFNAHDITKNEDGTNQAYWGPEVLTHIADSMHNVTLTVRPGEFIKIYADGKEVQSFPCPAGWNLRHQNMQFSIGAECVWGNGYDYFKGWVDNVTIYNFAMTEEQSAAYWQKGKVVVKDMAGSIISSIDSVPHFEQEGVYVDEKGLNDKLTATQFVNRLKPATVNALLDDGETTIPVSVTWKTVKLESDGKYYAIGEVDATNLGYATTLTGVTEVRQEVTVEKRDRKIVIDEAIENGTVVSDKAAAKLGESVVITVTANDGYELKELTVGGEAVTVNEDGTYTFTIKGNSDVEISATFAEKAKEEKKSGCKSSVIASSAMLAAAGIAVCAALKKKRG
ncbi:MAG TPA: hypothetical protein DCE65_04095 [Clostridiales bacterium]|nr:hypothetical protein [Clostridiales bacterium]